MRWTLVLERKTENALNPDIARRHLKYVAAAAERNKSLGFTARVGKLADPEVVLECGQERKRYLVKLRLEESKARGDEAARERFEHVRGVVERAARSKGWAILAGAAGFAAGDTPAEAATPAEPRTPFVPTDLTPGVIAERFADVYERDAHLRLLNDAVQTHSVTRGEIRAHTILFGLPGGCKSSLLERLKPIYDDAKFERMKIMDASTMTKAGLERWVLERAEADLLPEILAFEEIEKVDNKDNLKCLGSVMASGYLQRTNAVVGNVQVPAKFLVLATCNDEQALKEFMRGYIWDRFVNQVECPLPSEGVMHRILLDKVAKIPGGKECWAGHAMALARRMGVRTPRKIIGYLAGRHRLETGAYQKDVLHIADAGRREKAEMEVA
jgi:hypothetical protein